MVAQVAGSLMLLIVAGLFVRSLKHAGQMNLGFEAERLLNVTLDPQQDNYTEARTKQFYRELEVRLRALPGVQSESQASSVPITSFPSRQTVYAEGEHFSPEHRAPGILFNRVSPQYFQTMQITLSSGREFLDSDSEEMPLVAIVNQTMADRLWPHEAPIGKRFSVVSEAGPFIEVIGVAKDGKYQTIA
jgi:hypothetical protein